MTNSTRSSKVSRNANLSVLGFVLAIVIYGMLRGQEAASDLVYYIGMALAIIVVGGLTLAYLIMDVWVLYAYWIERRLENIGDVD